MFLEHNLAAQGTRFRRVIIRSAGRLLRKAAKSKSSLGETEFCKWLWSFLFESLGPGLGGRRALALALIGVAIDAGVPRACGRDGTATFNDTETMALFCCFGDANEANRLAAAELLCTHGRESVCGLSKADLHGLVEHSKSVFLPLLVCLVHICSPAMIHGGSCCYTLCEVVLHFMSCVLQIVCPKICCSASSHTIIVSVL